MICCASLLLAVVLLIAVAPVVAAATLTLIAYCAIGNKTGGDEAGHLMVWGDTVLDETDGRETARSMFGTEIVGGEYVYADKIEFDCMRMQNHRATLDAKTVEDVFPPGDRPRGDDDVKSVRHHMTTDADVDPVMVFLDEDTYTVLDGVHRIVAAYLTNSPIRYRVYRRATL